MMKGKDGGEPLVCWDYSPLDMDDVYVSVAFVTVHWIEHLWVLHFSIYAEYSNKFKKENIS